MPEPTPAAPQRNSRRQLIGRLAVTIVLVGLILWLLLGNLGDLSEVWEALKSVSAAEGLLLIGLTLVWRLLVATQLSASVPGLGVWRSCVASESAAAASNAIPGPSGTVMKLTVLRSWGFRTEAFANSWLFTSSLTNLVVLSAPALIVFVLVLEGVTRWPLVLAAVIGLLIALAGAVGTVAIIRSERFARWAGRTLGRMARWLAGIARRKPSDEDFEEAILHFRDGIVETWHARGPRIVVAVVASYIALGTLFIVSVRAVGLDRDIAPFVALVAVYCAVRLATMVEITPGGAGVTEAMYTAALLVVTDGAEQSLVVAAVILFRGLSYAGPLLLGCVALLVWRFKRSWRAHPPEEDPGIVAVTAVMVDQEPPQG